MSEVWNVVEEVDFVLKGFPFDLAEALLVLGSVDGGEVAFLVADDGGGTRSIVHEC